LQAIAHPLVESLGARVPRPFQGVAKDLGLALRPQQRGVLGHERLQADRGACEAYGSNVHGRAQSVAEKACSATQRTARTTRTARTPRTRAVRASLVLAVLAVLAVERAEEGRAYG